MEASSPSVEELAVAAAGGDRWALGCLYERCDRQVFGYVYRRVQTRTAAEDVTADVWLRVMTGIHRYVSHGDGGFLGWLLTIARRILLTRYRDDQRRPDLSSDVALLYWPCRTVGPLEQAVASEQAVEVLAALAFLTPRQRHAVTLRYIDGLSERETADRLGVSVGAVKQLAYRGKRRLRQTLESPSTQGRGALVTSRSGEG